MVHRADALDILYDTTLTVAQYPLATLDTGKVIIKGPLDTFLPPIVDVGEPQDMAGNWPSRVITAIFAERRYTRNAQAFNAGRLGRGQVAAQIHKLTILITIQ